MPPDALPENRANPTALARVIPHVTRTTTPLRPVAAAAMTTALLAATAGCVPAGAPPAAETVAIQAAASPSSAAATAASPGPAGTCGAEQDVPTFRGDAARTGHMPDSAPLATPAIRWTWHADRPLASSPVVAAGTAFQSTTGGALDSIDVRSGSVRWTVTLGGGLTTPLVLAALVIVGSTDGRLTAVDAGTGTIRWAVDLGSDILGAPAPVADGGPANAPSGVIVATTFGRVSRVRLDGGIAWTTENVGRIDRSPAVGSGVVVVPVAAGAVVALDPGTGASRWRAAIGKAGVGSPAVDGDLVVAAAGIDSTGADAHAVVAVDARTGADRWRWTASTKPAYTPAVANGLAITVSEDGAVVGLDRSTGVERWREAVDKPVEALAAASGSLAITASNDGELLAFDLATGAVRWRTPSTGVPFAPVVSCGLVLVPTDLGQLTAFGAPS